MKTPNLILSVLLFGMSAQAAEQSQTMIRLDNGTMQTIPAFTADYNLTPNSAVQTIVKNAGLLYDKGAVSGSITAMGGNYALTDDTIFRVSENGTLYTTKVTYKAAALGGNFFINKGNNELIAIDSSGCYLSTGHIASDAKLIGGNFYIDKKGVLVTVKHGGQAACDSTGMVTVKTGLADFSGATKAGGNFFVQKDGSIIGVASETGFYTNPQTVESKPEKIGGNYFIGADKILYTVSNTGFVMKQSPIIGKIKTFGYSYLIADDGYLIYVDGKGVPHTEMVRVYANGSAQKVEKITDLGKMGDSFIPARQ